MNKRVEIVREIVIAEMRLLVGKIFGTDIDYRTTQHPKYQEGKINELAYIALSYFFLFDGCRTRKQN